MTSTPEPCEPNPNEQNPLKVDAPVPPTRSQRRPDGTVDWAAAGRKAWETRRRNAAPKTEQSA